MKKAVLLLVPFGNKKCKSVANSALLFLYRTNAIPCNGGCIEKRHSITEFMADFHLQERIEGCFVLILRLVINQKMKALVRVINYPARGVGNNNQLTIAIITTSARFFEVMKI
jgi:hypothetical protein